MAQHNEIGKLGETKAMELLISKGYKILHHNWKYKHTEVDIIFQDKNEIVFVEVKTRTNITFGYPESFVSNAKINLLAQAADGFRERYDYHGELRFDVISVIITDDGYEIEHFLDSFYPRG